MFFLLHSEYSSKQSEQTTQNTISLKHLQLTKRSMALSFHNHTIENIPIYICWKTVYFFTCLIHKGRHYLEKLTDDAWIMMDVWQRQPFVNYPDFKMPYLYGIMILLLKISRVSKLKEIALFSQYRLYGCPRERPFRDPLIPRIQSY